VEKTIQKTLVFRRLSASNGIDLPTPEKTELQQQIIDKNRIISKRGLI
jgi:hypothetical protein